MRNVVGGAGQARSPQIVADAAYAVLTRDARTCTANLFIDDEVLLDEGVTDLAAYSAVGFEGDLALDIFVDPA
ncbi:hypothetical protein ACWCQ0_23930 [Streptomyces massasporeus]|uniref:Uncharacterized protein n=1 Tax=Streptomyces massasporeus TaxID=67324 RepID=A0ABW6LLZ4_9ACTN